MASGRTRNDRYHDDAGEAGHGEVEHGQVEHGQVERGEVSAAEAGQEGLRQIVAMTGKEPLGVTSIEATEDGWLVGVEMVEENRIPSSADMLGLYEVDLDMTGGLLGYRRTQRYQRGKGDPR